MLECCSGLHRDLHDSLHAGAVGQHHGVVAQRHAREGHAPGLSGAEGERLLSEERLAAVREQLDRDQLGHTVRVASLDHQGLAQVGRADELDGLIDGRLGLRLRRSAALQEDTLPVHHVAAVVERGVRDRRRVDAVRGDHEGHAGLRRHDGDRGTRGLPRFDVHWNEGVAVARGDPPVVDVQGDLSAAVGVLLAHPDAVDTAQSEDWPLALHLADRGSAGRTGDTSQGQGHESRKGHSTELTDGRHLQRLLSPSLTSDGCMSFTVTE